MMQQSDLESRGWCVDFDRVDVRTSSEDTEQHLLDTDIRKVRRGVGSLPVDINGRASGTLEGPHVLQLLEFRDVSGPTRFKSPGSSTTNKNRLLMLRLTDGVRECKALEARKPISCLNLKELLPGMKIRVKGVPVRHGVLILNESDIDVLGGRVVTLAEAYEAQQLYGGADRNLVSGDDMPPKFKPFDPTRPAKRSNIDKNKCRREVVDLNTEGSQQNQDKRRPSKVTSTAAANLLEKMTDKSSGGDRGRGRGRGRRDGGRRQGRNHLGDDGNTQCVMTLDEWEASRKKLPGKECASDYALAMKLQEQFDLEDQIGGATLGLQNSLYQNSKLSADAPGQIHGSVDHRSRGGRGRKRGGRRGKR